MSTRRAAAAAPSPVTSTPAPMLGEVRGHERAIGHLMAALDSGRMHHAWLFEGPDGVGKTLLARAIAGLLLCDDRAPGARDRCGVCRSCRMLDGPGHPDQIEIEPTGRFIAVDRVRELVAATRYRPVQSRVRVIRILEADALREEAANALLKTLEEPGGATVFQLVSSHGATLLSTIRSRCMPVRCGVLPIRTVQDVLAAAGHGGRAAEAAARLSGGSVGVALHRMESAAFLEREAFYAAFTEAIASSDTDALQYGQELASQRGATHEPLALLRTLYRDAAMLAAGASATRLLDPDGERFARELSRQGVDRLVRVSAKIDEMERQIDGNANARMCMESLLLDCAAAARG
jgi:DNA polymerase-3 subunit delta'